jgi:hypothetical protein
VRRQKRLAVENRLSFLISCVINQLFMAILTRSQNDFTIYVTYFYDEQIVFLIRVRKCIVKTIMVRARFKIGSKFGIMETARKRLSSKIAPSFHNPKIVSTRLFCLNSCDLNLGKVARNIAALAPTQLRRQFRA